MFWGLIMEPNKRYTQTVEKSFHVSMASLDGATADNNIVQVMLCYGGRNYLLCSLKKDTAWQVPLDLNFQEGTSIAFTSNGRGHVHLTGYLIPDEEDDDLDLEEAETEAEEEEEEVPQLVEKQNKRKAKESPEMQVKKMKQSVKSVIENALAKQAGKKNARKEEEEDEDDSEDEEDEEIEESFEMSTQIDDDSDDAEDDDEDDDEEEEDDSEDEEDKAALKQKMEKEKAKSQQKKNQQKDQQQQKQKTNAKQEKQKMVNGKDTKTEQAKQETKKNKNEQQQNNAQQAQKKRVVDGGVQIEDVKMGNGTPAKSGKFVSVYYIGKLKNGKKFDSTMQGEGFKFRLGKGEVIKGWDVGIAGMKVGGKRRITIPPGYAYGSKGSPPTIPGNSTLVFDVELKNVH